MWTWDWQLWTSTSRHRLSKAKLGEGRPRLMPTVFSPAIASWELYKTLSKGNAAQAYKCRLWLFWRRSWTRSCLSIDQPRWLSMQKEMSRSTATLYILLRAVDGWLGRVGKEISLYAGTHSTRTSQLLPTETTGDRGEFPADDQYTPFSTSTAATCDYTFTERPLYVQHNHVKRKEY